MKKTLTIVVLSALLISVLIPTFACGEVRDGYKSIAVVLADENGNILFEKNPTEKRPIASMTKIMTLLCIYDAVKQGKISLSDDVTASERAASMGGSQVFLDANSVYKAEELVKSIIVCSANDSCVAMAEHIGGSVENFVACMNARASELGLVATHFENCTGLPAVSQYSCAADVAKMFSELIRNEQYFSCAGIWMQDFVHPSGRVTGMTNTNKLVRFYDGCDGGKTGYTCEAKHCLAATAKHGNTRVIAVVIGAPDSKTRFAEVSSLFNYAFANYENKCYLSAESTIQSLPVRGGKQSSLSVVASGSLNVFASKGASANYTVELNLPDCVSAPIEKGQKVGEATLVDENGSVVKTVDVVAVESISQKSLWDYIREAM